MEEVVQVISTCLVGGTASSKVSSCSKIELTPWDLQFLLIDPMQKGHIFYKPTPQQETSLLTSSSSTCLIDHLKTSLSRTLDFFPPLAGRLSTVKNVENNTISFSLTCNNAGAEFVHAIAPKLTVGDILDQSSSASAIVQNSLFTLDNVPNMGGVTKPLLGVQVTELADGYFIGITFSHCAGDGLCFLHFFNSWSEISRGSEYITKLPVLKRWFPENINPPIHLPLDLLDHNNKEPARFELPPLNARIFHISKESTGKLKAKANSEMGTESISSLQAVLAHLWRSVTRCRGIDDKEEIEMSIIIGTRPRINPPLPEEYWGNAACFKHVKTTAGKLLGEKGLGWTALQINKIIASLNNEQVVEEYKGWVEKPGFFKKGSLFVPNVLSISTSPKSIEYTSIDFGWGIPVGVRSGMANKGDGKVTIFPAVEQGSIDIEISLIPETLQAMLNDTEFMEAVTL